jgi:predicted  nucleic acid-binding Zn-ribbon protein
VAKLAKDQANLRVRERNLKDTKDAFDKKSNNDKAEMIRLTQKIIELEKIANTTIQAVSNKRPRTSTILPPASSSFSTHLAANGSGNGIQNPQGKIVFGPFY